MLNKKCFVLDLDGTVYLGDIPIQETVDFILRHWDTIDFHFLSNNTSKAPTTYVNKLTRMGIPATLDRILSPVTPLIAHLRGNGIRTVYPVGNRDFVACLRERMPELNVLDYGVSEGAEAVVLAYDTELTYEKLTHAALLLQSYDRKDMVMVGDRLSTDKKLAENAGIDFILVLSGEAKLSDLPGLERQPTLVVDNLGQLESA